MHEYFISSTKQELKICILFRTFSEVKSLLGIIVSYVLLKTSSKVTSLLGVTVSLIGVDYSIKSLYIKGASTKNISIMGTYVGKTYTRSIYIHGSTCAKSACTRVVSNKNTYIRSVYADEHSEMYLQPFQILKVRGAR